MIRLNMIQKRPARKKKKLARRLPSAENIVSSAIFLIAIALAELAGALDYLM
jgi:hypothetical protein